MHAEFKYLNFDDKLSRRDAELVSHSHLVLSSCRVPSTATVRQELVQGMVKDGRNPASKGAPVVHARRTSTLSQNYLTGVLRLH